MKYEYKVYYLGPETSAEKMEQDLNKLGAEGWDYCFMSGKFITFKRKLP